MKKTATLMAALLVAALAAPAQAGKFGTSAEANKASPDQLAKGSHGAKKTKSKKA